MADKACEQATKHHGYIMQMDYLERMSKRYVQTQCPKCKLWHVWKRKPTPAPTTGEDS
jgi:hypothetical protein